MVSAAGKGDEAQARLEILDAMVIALERPEEFFAIVVSAVEADQAKQLLKGAFDLSEVQATAVVDLQIRRFTERERSRIVEERDAVSAQTRTR